MTSDALQHFFVVLADARQLPALIDRELTEARAFSPYVDTNGHVRAAHDAVAQLVVKLAALDLWARQQQGSDSGQTEAPPELPPWIAPGVPEDQAPGHTNDKGDATTNRP